MEKTTTIAVKTVSEDTIYFHDGKYKNHPSDLGEWWGNDIVNEIDFRDFVEKNVPEGKYKITITLEKID